MGIDILYGFIDELIKSAAISDVEKNSPMIAWELVHGKKMKSWRPGRTPLAQEKLWKGIAVDKHLKNTWLENLNSIKNIEIRATCEGHGKDWPTYVAFRVSPKLQKKSDKIAKLLTVGSTKAKAVTGRIGQDRIIVATKKYYKSPGWSKWWETLPNKIDLIVNRKKI